jgi:ribosomal subunit interface protein
MIIPPEVTFRNLERSDAIEAAVLERIEKLDRFYPRITSCRVIVEASHHRARTAGTVYHVRVDLTVPGGELVGQYEPQPQRFHEDVYIALREAFDQVRRELEEYARRQRGDVKAHEERPHGRVSKIFPDRGYGFIETPDGREVYFHGHCVHGHGFNRLSVGTQVRFVEEEGEQGPQASVVFIAGKG